MNEGTEKSAQTAGDTPRKKNWGKRIGLIAGVLVIVLVILVGIAPTLVSMGLGKGYITSAVSNQLNGSFSAKSITIGWVKGPSATDLQLKDASGNPIASVGQFAAPRFTLMRLLGGSLDLGEVRLSDVQAQIVQRPDGSTNITDALAPLLSAPSEPSTEPTKIPAGTAIDFALEGSNFITYAAPDMDPVRVDLNKLTLVAPNARDLNLVFEAGVQQGVESGSVTINAVLKDAVDASGLMDLPAADMNANINLSSLPVVAFDRLAQLNGALLASLGPQLNAQVQTSGNLENLKAAISADAQQLSANITVDVVHSETGPVTQMPQEGEIKFTLTPEAAQAWLAHYELGDLPVPTNPVDITLKLSDLSIGQKNGTVDLEGMAINAVASVGPVTFDAGALGSFGLRDTQLSATTKRLGEDIQVNIATTATQDSHSGSLKLDGSVANLGDGRGGIDPKSPELLMQLEGKVIDLPLALADHIAALDGLIVQAVGDRLRGDIQVAMKPNAPDAKPGTLSVKLQAANMSVGVDGTFDPATQMLSVSGPIAFTATPGLIDRLLGATAEEPAPLAFASPVKTQIKLNRLQVPFAAVDPSTVHVAMGLEVEPTSFTLREVPEPFELKRVSLDVPEVTLDQPLVSTLKAMLVQSGQPMPLDAVVTANNLLYGTPRLDLKAQSKALPLAIVDNLGKLDGLTQELLGNTIPLEVDATATLGEMLVANADIRSKSQPLDAALQATYTPQRVVVKQGGTVQLNLPPDRAQALLMRYAGDTASMKFVDPVQVNLAVDKVNLPLHEGQADIAGLASDLVVTVPHIGLHEPSNDAFVGFDGLKVTLNTPRLAQQALLNTTGGVHVIPMVDREDEDPQNAPIEVTVDARSLMNPEGQIAMDTLTADINASLDDFPVMVIDDLAKMNNLLLNTLGNTASLRANGSFPGTLTVFGESDQATTNLPLSITRDIDVTIASESVSTLKITRQTVEGLLGQMHPAFGDAVGSEDPVKLTIYPDGFQMPLANGWDPANSFIKGNLDAGSIRMAKAGWLFKGLSGALTGAVTDTLRLNTLSNSAQPKRELTEEETYLVKFHPVNFVLDKGEVVTEQLWITSPDIGIGFKGKANLTTERIDMAMGILGASLVSEELGAADLVEQGVRTDQIYDLPMKGTLSAPQPDYPWLLAQLAGSSVRQALDKGSGGIGGALFDAVGGGIQQGKRDKLNINWSPPKEETELAIATANERLKVISQKKDPNQQAAQEGAEAQEAASSSSEEEKPRSPKKILEGLFR